MADFGDYQFICAICQDPVHDIERNGRDRHLAPVCRGCEQPTTYCWHGGRRRVRGSRVTHGTFMDRRKLLQIFAIADEIEGEARRQQWRGHHAAA